MRIAKFLSRAGICSRRKAEDLMMRGLILVNGQHISEMGYILSPGDIITASGRSIPFNASGQPTRLWLFHKPAGTIVSHRDPQGRPTIFSLLPRNMPRVVSVGRLDLNTEGLILLTNSGALSRLLEIPDSGVTREYHCRYRGQLLSSHLTAAEQGVTLEGVHYRQIAITPLSEGEWSTRSEIEHDQPGGWVHIALKEGKKREVRRVMESFGLQVLTLRRVSYGPFTLHSVPKQLDLMEVPGTAIADAVAAINLRISSGEYVDHAEHA